MPGGHFGGPHGGPGGHFGGPHGGPRGYRPPPPRWPRGRGCIGCCLPVVGIIAVAGALVAVLASVL